MHRDRLRNVVVNLLTKIDNVISSSAFVYFFSISAGTFQKQQLFSIV